MKMKNRALAATLNLIPGLGYLYLGRRRMFGALLIASSGLYLASLLDPAVMAREDSFVSAWELVTTMAGAVIVEAAFVYDAYREATRSNKKAANA